MSRSSSERETMGFPHQPFTLNAPKVIGIPPVKPLTRHMPMWIVFFKPDGSHRQHWQQWPPDFHGILVLRDHPQAR